MACTAFTPQTRPQIGNVQQRHTINPIPTAADSASPRPTTTGTSTTDRPPPIERGTTMTSPLNRRTLLLGVVPAAALGLSACGSSSSQSSSTASASASGSASASATSSSATASASASAAPSGSATASATADDGYVATASTAKYPAQAPQLCTPTTSAPTAPRQNPSSKKQPRSSTAC